MKGGGGGTTTQTNTNEPWGPAEPYLKDILGEAEGVYGSPAGYFPNSTTAPINPYTQAGFGGITNRALQGSDIQRAGGDVLRYTMAGGYNDPSAGWLSGVMGQSGGGANPASAYLENTASGAMLGQNPFLDATYDQAASRVTEHFQDWALPGLESRYDLAGRGGSGAFANALGRETQGMSDTLNDLATSIYGGAYGQERGYMEQAAGNLGQSWLSGFQPGMQAAGQLSAGYGADVNRQLGAAQAAPGYAATDYADYDRLRDLGQGYQGYAQSALDSEQARWNFLSGQPWQNLGNYANLALGIGSSGGTQTQTAPNQNTGGGDVLGGLLGIASMFL